MNPKLVYLVQADTTVGFSSSCDERLSAVKQRSLSQKILQTVDSFHTLTFYTRVPQKFKKRVRNSKKTTFIYPNLKSFRVISKDCEFYDFLQKFNILYSTSANKTKTNFERDFAYENAEVIVEDVNGFSEKTASKIFKLTKSRILKIR